MASNINPNNIDGSYPVAGQDNNSQGFRDNFTNTKTNFQYAKNEINDLQNKALLKAALTGGTLDNNMNDNLIYAAKIQDFSLTRVAQTTTTGTVTLNYASGHYQTVTPTANITLAFSNWPTSGSYGYVRLQVTITDIAYTMTIPAAVSLGLEGIQGISPGTSGVSNTITFMQPGTYEFGFSTSNNGSTITLFDLNRTPTNFISFVCPSADYTLANSSSAQNAFNTPFDTITLPSATTFMFEASYYLTRAAGTTSHTISTLFGGTATLTSITYTAESTSTTGNVLGAVSRIYGTANTAVAVTGASTSATENNTINLNGIIRTNVGGTFIPQIKYSAAPGGAPTLLKNSYFKLTPIGDNTVTDSGYWG